MWGAIKKAINSNLNKSLDVLIQEKSTETNSKIDSKSSQSSVDDVKSLVQDGNNLIGSTNNNGGTATSGSIFAKLNKLLTDWTTTRAGYVDTTISSRASQSGLNTLQGTANTINANVGALVNGMHIKSIQKLSLVISSQGNTGSFYFNLQSPVNTAKSIILQGACELTNKYSLNFYDNTRLTMRIYQASFIEETVELQIIEFY